MPKLATGLLAAALALSGCVTAPPGASPEVVAEARRMNEARAGLALLGLGIVALGVVAIAAAGPAEEDWHDGGHHHHHGGEGW